MFFKNHLIDNELDALKYIDSKNFREESLPSALIYYDLQLNSKLQLI